MYLINIDSILVPGDRHRKAFDEPSHRALITSIQETEYGLLHPIVIRLDGDHYTLVAGERRLRAVQEIYALGGSFRHNGDLVPEGMIPYVSLGELSSLSAEEAEYAENEIRAQLSWQERALASSRIMNIRKEQAAVRGEAPPTYTDISTEVRGKGEGQDGGRARQDTRSEIIIAPFLSDPEISAAPSLQEGYKILKRKEQAARHIALAAEVGRTFSSAEHRLICGDGVDWLSQCPEGIFDVILTDPPYGMGADSFGDSGGLATGPHGYDDGADVFIRCFTALEQHAFRVAKQQAHLYVFCDLDRFPAMRAVLSVAGWTVFRTPLIWYKPTANRAPWPHSGPHRKYELILYAKKGDRNVNHLAGDVLTHQADENLGHSAQKPVALLVDLLKRSVRPGDTVLDPFAGTGGVLAAAHELSCRATAIELDPGAYGIAAGRLKGLGRPADLLEGL